MDLRNLPDLVNLFFLRIEKNKDLLNLANRLKCHFFQKKT